MRAGAQPSTLCPTSPEAAGRFQSARAEVADADALGAAREAGGAAGGARWRLLWPEGKGVRVLAGVLAGLWWMVGFEGKVRVLWDGC